MLPSQMQPEPQTSGGECVSEPPVLGSVLVCGENLSDKNLLSSAVVAIATGYRAFVLQDLKACLFYEAIRPREKENDRSAPE